MVFLSIPYPHFITFCLVSLHHDVLQTSATASKRFRTEPKGCILTQLSEATCVRNVLIVKNLEHGQFKEWYHVKEERLFYLDSTHLFVVRLFFQKVAKMCNFWKVANFCDRVNPL